MENFGLGLVLGFRDDASAGVMKVLELVEHLKSSLDDIGNHASGSIGQLTATSSAIGVVGVAISGLGAAVAAPFVALGSHVVQLSSQFENMEITLNALYGSAEAGSEKLQHFMKFAAETPFRMTDIVPAAVRMKAIGQDADEMFTTMDRGKSVSQSFLSFVGDLAALRPDKGIQLATQGIQEFLEGNGRGLKMMFGMSTKGLLGEEAAQDLAGRAKQVTEMIAKMHGAGLMQSMNDTWTVIFSNIQDQFDRLTYYIGKSGFFNTIKGYFRDVYNFIRDLSEDRLKAIGETISGAMEVIAMPLGLVMKGLIEFGKVLVNLMEEYPMVMKFAIAITGLGAQLLVFTGVSLVVVAVLLKLRAAFLTFTGAQTIMSGFAKTLAVGLRTILTSILPVTIAIGLLYYAFRTNLFGIRTVVEGVGKFVSNFFTVLSDAMGHIDFEKGIFSLSKKNHNLADQMGITDLITAIVRLRYYWHYFTEGLSEGINNAMEYLDNLGKRFAFLGAPIKEITGVAREFFKIFSETGHKDDVQELGKNIGNWLPMILAVVAGLKLITTAFSAIFTAVSVVSGAVGALGSVFSGIFSFIAGAIRVVFPVIESLYSMIWSLANGFRFMESLAAWFPRIATVINLVVRAGGLVMTVLGYVGSAISFIAQAIGLVLTVIGAVVGLPAWAVGLIIVALVALGVAIYTFRDSIFNFLSGVATKVYEVASSLGSSIYKVISSAVSKVYSYVSSIASSIMTAISPVIQYVSLVGELIYQYLRLGFYKAINFITSTASSISGVVGRIFNDAVTAVSGFASSVGSGIKIVVGAVLSSVGKVLSTIGNGIANNVSFVVGKVSSVMSSVYMSVSSVMSAIGSVISRIFNDAVRAVTPFVSDIISGVMYILGIVSSVFSQVSSVIGQCFTEAFNWVYSVFISPVANEMNFLLGVATDVFGQIESFVTGVFDSISSVASGVLSWIEQKLDDLLSSAKGLLDMLPSLPSMSDLQQRVGLVKEAADNEKTGNGKALGGIFPQGDFVTHFAEDSGEAAIPIRNTAFSHSLWERTGQLIGALKPAGGEKTPVMALSSEATTSSHEGKDSSSNDSQRGESIIFEKGSIVFEVHTENFDAEKAADTLMPIIKRKAELIQMSTRRKSSFGGAFS